MLHDAFGHQELVEAVQRLRASAYLADGAITTDDVTIDGRHESFEDERSWHFVMLGEDERPAACLWYRRHDLPVTVDQMRIERCPLARDTHWRQLLRRSINGDVTLARRERVDFGEIGGWAVAEHNRRTPDGILLVLAVFALGHLIGHSLAITTATVRHCSAMMLRRLGGTPLTHGDVEIPSYFDPQYGCDMELLRFDSRRPDSRYVRAVNLIAAQLSHVRVLSPLAAIPQVTAAIAPASYTLPVNASVAAA
jgi:hypothetical protein